MAGLVIPHDSSGSHLNPSGEKIDPELEKKFQGSWQEIVSDMGRISIKWKASNSEICWKWINYNRWIRWTLGIEIL